MRLSVREGLPVTRRRGESAIPPAPMPFYPEGTLARVLGAWDMEVSEIDAPITQ